MKIYTRAALALAGLLVLGTGAYASTWGDELVANVPFEFSIGKTTLPRDTYRVSRLEGTTDVLLIQSLRHGVVTIVQKDGSRSSDETPHLVFHKYGERYFLSAVKALESVRFTVPETRQERAAADQVGAEASPEMEVVAVRLR
jgi:hypothetical protein